MSRDFSKVSPAIWRSRRFSRLTDRGKIGFLYMLSCPHVTSAGVYELPQGYACADLQWATVDYQAVLKELVAAEMIDHDPDTETVMIERWYVHNGPMSDDHATGIRRFLAKVECERLREKALAAFEASNDQRIELAAQKAAEREMKKASSRRSVAELVGSGSRLSQTAYMRGGNG